MTDRAFLYGVEEAKFRAEIGRQIAAHVADANVDTVPEDDLARPGRKPTREEVRAVVAYELNEIPEYELEEVDSTTDAVIDLYDRAAKGEL